MFSISPTYTNYPYTYYYASEYEIWLRKDINDPLLRKVAEAMVMSHEKLQGNLTGPLFLYKTQTDRAQEIQGEKVFQLDVNFMHNKMRNS